MIYYFARSLCRISKPYNKA